MLADASGLIALLDPTESHHDRCVAAAERHGGPLVTSWPAFTEAMYLLQQRSGWPGANALWTLWLRTDLRLAEQSTTALARMQELMAKYADVPIALADASLVVLAEDRRETRIFSLDSDFHTYVAAWGGSKHAFEVIPGPG